MIHNFPQKANKLEHYVLIDIVPFSQDFFHDFRFDEHSIQFFLDFIHFTK
jgi:hypothetical protein